ncbi:MAG: hypothetical protein ACI9LG_001695 [Moritella dasanensis]|jgi:hypothetical protein
MNNTPQGTEELFHFRDQFCCLQLTVSMILDTGLQNSTSRLYPLVKNSFTASEELKNLYYLPNSMITLSKSDFLLDLIGVHLGYLKDLSNVVMSDGFARMLVEKSGTDSAKSMIELILGNANYRCAFAPIAENLYFSEQEHLTKLDADKILPISEQNNLGLLTNYLASNANTRKEVQTCLNDDSLNDFQKQKQIIKVLTSIQLPLSKGSTDNISPRNITAETAGIIVNYLVAGNMSELSTFLGVNIYSASW